MYVHNSWCVVSWGEGEKKNQSQFVTLAENREHLQRREKTGSHGGGGVLTLKAVVNWASALSMQFTEIQ